MKTRSSTATDRTKPFLNLLTLRRISAGARTALSASCNRRAGNPQTKLSALLPLRLARAALVAAVSFVALISPTTAQDYGFTVVDFPIPATQETFGVLDLDDSGDVFYYVKDINLYDAFLYRSGTKAPIWSGSRAILGGSANHKGSAILWIQGTPEEVLVRQGDGPFELVAFEKHEATGTYNPFYKNDDWWITGVRMNEADAWVLSGTERHGIIIQAGDELQHIEQVTRQEHFGLFGSLWARRVTRKKQG